jgi:hypothetical protein
MNGFELIAMPRRAGLKDDGPTEIEVLARVQAPDIPES